MSKENLEINLSKFDKATRVASSLGRLASDLGIQHDISIATPGQALAEVKGVDSKGRQVKSTSLSGFNDGYVSIDRYNPNTGKTLHVDVDHGYDPKIDIVLEDDKRLDVVRRGRGGYEAVKTLRGDRAKRVHDLVKHRVSNSIHDEVQRVAREVSGQLVDDEDQK